MNKFTTLLAMRAFISTALLFGGVSFMGAQVALAADENPKAQTTTAATTAGMIKTLRGNVTIERQGKRFNASLASAVKVGDKLRTGERSAVGIALKDDTLLSAGPNSTLVINAFTFDPTTHDGKIGARINRGTLSVVSGKISKQSPDAVKYSTPTTVFGVRGTEFVIQVNNGVE